MKKTKQEVEKVVNNIAIWSYGTKRTKTEVSEDSIELLKKIGKNKPSDLDLEKMINLHNEYRFPLVQLIDTTQANIDVAKELFIFLSQTKK